MAIEDKEWFKFYKKHEKFCHAVEGILIILLMLGLNFFLYNDYQLKKEISQNCGWAEEDFECYCQKSEAIALKNRMNEEMGGELNLDDLVIVDP